MYYKVKIISGYYTGWYVGCCLTPTTNVIEATIFNSNDKGDTSILFGENKGMLIKNAFFDKATHVLVPVEVIDNE